LSERFSLITNGSATGSSVIWRGGKGTFLVTGTFGGTTVTLQFLGTDNATWIDVGAEAALTAAGLVGFELAAGLIRAEVVGGTPSALYAAAIANGS
jgi:hypothetical protein